MIVEIKPSSADELRRYLPGEKIEDIKNKTKTGLAIYTGNDDLCGVAVYSIAGPLFQEEGNNLYLEDLVNPWKSKVRDYDKDGNAYTRQKTKGADPGGLIRMELRDFIRTFHNFSSIYAKNDNTTLSGV
ncbi:MAG: hypothetical protein K6E91_14660 [Butyrivibrio sp.]|nr:hypothetical protein [Butyrivibrio sp.]